VLEDAAVEKDVELGDAALEGDAARTHGGVARAFEGIVPRIGPVAVAPTARVVADAPGGAKGSSTGLVAVGTTGSGGGEGAVVRAVDPRPSGAWVLPPPIQ
jgi:hypothetical protein